MIKLVKAQLNVANTAEYPIKKCKKSNQKCSARLLAAPIAAFLLAPSLPQWLPNPYPV